MELFSHLNLVTGPEEFLVQRESARLIAAARLSQPDAGVTTASGNELSAGLLDQITGTDLFSSATITNIVEAEKTPKAVEPDLMRLTKQVPDQVALIICHAGGNQGRSLLNHLKVTATNVVECPVIKPSGLAKFVINEVRNGGKTISPAAAQSLVDAVGQDLRSLVGAVSQLVADTDSDAITATIVNRYFAGRASITAYLVSDDALAGKAGEAIVKLRWALSTGVAHVLITSSLANSLRQIGNYLSLSRRRQPTAADIGAPSWKLRDISASSRAWSEQSVASAIRAVSLADAQIKGAGQDPDFALEQLVIRLASLRRSSHQSSKQL